MSTDNLQIELERVQNQLEAAGQSGQTDAVERLERRVSEIMAQIESQEAVKQQQAAVIAEVQDPESSFVLSVGGFTVDFREYARDE